VNSSINYNQNSVADYLREATTSFNLNGEPVKKQYTQFPQETDLSREFENLIAEDSDSEDSKSNLSEESREEYKEIEDHVNDEWLQMISLKQILYY